MKDSIWVDMKWMEEQTGLKYQKIRSGILLPNKSELEKFSKYPEKRGERWKFSREYMTEWLKNNPHKIS